MKTVENLMDIIKIYRKAELAKKFGRAPSAITYWQKHGVPDSIFKLAEEIVAKEMLLINRDDIILIPPYNNGKKHLNNPSAFLYFKKEWVRNALGVIEDNLKVITVVGDSMEPKLHDGDIAILNISHKTIVDNAIYALEFNGSLLVKRVQKFISGAINILSDNSKYMPESLSSEQANNIKVVGRVIWVGSKI
ncbi:MAG: hypothetical protein FWD70_05475 [Desulfuromonadales bacterium]|nr:hypothetical protein [Desulfuromonadales bacterium]